MVFVRRKPIKEADGGDNPEVQALRRLVQETGQTSDWSSMLVKDQLRGTSRESDDNFVYGEVNLASFTALLRQYGIAFAPEGVFYDLGCGAGKAVLVAALSPHFSEAYGIEVLECTFEVADVLTRLLKEDILGQFRPADSVKIEVINASIFDSTDWVTHADVCYCNCVTWPNDTMSKLAALSEGMKAGSLFITCSVPLSSPAFVIIETRSVQFGWGLVTVFIQECMPFGISWQSRRRVRPNGPPVDFLLDVPSLIASGALSLPLGPGAADALVTISAHDRVLVPSCSTSGVPEGLVAHGLSSVSAFDHDVNVVAEFRDAQAKGQAGGASTVGAPRASYLVGDVIDPVLHAEFTHGVPHRIPEHISIWECLQPGAYDVILNQTILDVILPMHTRTADLVEEELRAEQAAGGDYGEGPSGARGPRRAFAARMAHKALASLCAMLRPGGTLLLVAQRPPEEALLVLSSGFGLLWDVEHREIFAVPTTDPGAGPTKLHLYACRKRATASVRVSGHLVMPASHEAWDASSGRCSFGATGKAMFFQELFECLTCGLEAVCASCARKCHAGHDTKGIGQLGQYETSSDGEGEAEDETPAGTAADQQQEDPEAALGCDGEGGWKSRPPRALKELTDGDWCTGFCDCGFSGLCLAE